MKEHKFDFEAIGKNIAEYWDDYFYAVREKAERVLIDNGIEADEAEVVLQAIGYVLLDTELYPEEDEVEE